MSSPAGFTLLLTATVQPRAGLPDSVVASADLRRAKYAANLRGWLDSGLPLESIVLAENSGASLEFLEKAIARHRLSSRVELISLPDAFDGRLGKGYGEARLIESALRESLCLRGTDRIFKVTGLQTVTNIGRLNARIGPEMRWVVDVRDHRLYQAMGRSRTREQSCDTRCFFMEPGFYLANVAACWREAPPEREFYLEHAFYRAAKRLANMEGVGLRFPIEPRYRGVAGHWHKDYDSPRELAKWLLRATIRRLFPRLKV